MAQTSVLVPDLSSADWVKWKPIRDGFEAAWQTGRRPPLDAYLPPAPRLWQVVDLVAIDLEMRLKAGEPARVEDYLGRFAELGRHDQALADLVKAEFEQRRQRESVTEGEYARRFPHITAAWLTGSTAAAGVPASAVAEPATPAIAGYEVLGILGHGGMGVVYKARELKLNRLVAIKLILAEAFADVRNRERFKAEAEAVARLNHPNIVGIHGVGEIDGRPFLALEYCPGGSLAVNLANTPLAPREAAALIITLARAVHAMHLKGIIHRDLKPGNVLLSPLPSGGEGPGVRGMGTPKVSDFGLAKQLDEPSRTASTAYLGTPSYMAPEQARGKTRELGPACDIYALGALLYECLTRRPPFKGATSLDTMRQVVDDEPVPPARLNGQVARDLETICLKCLQKVPHERYASAQALADDLQRFLDHQPIAARPVGLVGRARRWARRSPVVAALTAGLAAVLILTTVGAVVAALQYRAKADSEARARADLEEQLYAKNIAIAERELSLNQDIGLATKLLAECPKRLRGWEWDYLMRRRDGERLPITGHAGGLWAAVFSPDGQRIATASIDGTAKVWDAATGRLVVTFTEHAIQIPPLLRAFAPTPPRVPVLCVAFSPDGRRVASGGLAPRIDLDNLKNLPNWKDLSDPRKAKGIVHIWDAETGKIAMTFDQQTGMVDTLAFSPDGTRVASSSISAENGFTVWETATGRALDVVRGHANHVHRLRFSPDGRFIASGSTDGVAKLWNAATFKEIISIARHTAPVYDIAFSPDSARFATASVDGTVGVWDTATGAPALPPLRGHSGATMGVAFSPDGKRIVTGGYDKTVRLWDAATGMEMITLRGHADMVTGVVFSPNGRQVLSASLDKQARVWDATPLEESAGPGLFTLVGHTDRVNSVAFSRDGVVLASASWDKTIRLWDGQTGAALRTLEGHEAPVWGVAFSSDGGRVATASWDRTARVWDTATGKVLTTFHGQQTPLMAVAFSPKDNVVATCSFEGLVTIWDAATGKETAARAGHLFPALAVAFDPDGARVASGSGDRTAKIWNARTGAELLTLKGHDGAVSSVAFSPDGQRLASASWDQTVRIWDARTGKLLMKLEGHTDRVQAVTFSPDGSRIATASEDKTMRLWDAATGKELPPPRHQHGIVHSVAFSPDGKRVAAGSWSPTAWVKVWDARR